MRTVIGIGFRRETWALEPGESTWLRVILARFVATLAIAAAVFLLPVFEPLGTRLAVIVASVGFLINGMALAAVRRGHLPGLLLPLADLALALVIVAVVPDVLAIAAIVFASVNVLYVVWYGAGTAATLAAGAVVGLGAIGFASGQPYWVPTIVCLAICSATSIVVMDAICAGVSRAHGRYQALVNGLDAVVWEKDREGQKTFVSENVEEVVGTSREAFMGSGFLASRVHPDDRPELDDARQRNRAGHSSEAHFKVLDDDGVYRHLYERVSVSRSDSGGIESSQALLVDESARWSAQAEVGRYADFMSGIPIALSILRLVDESDPHSMEVVSLNLAAQRMFGVAPPGTRLTSLLRLPDAWVRRLASVARGTEAFEQPFLELPEMDGVFAVRVVPLPDRHLGLSIEDVTKRARVAESFRHQARHDMLTGLANRTYLYERMRKVFDEPQNPAAALYVLDLDNFKQVNDSLGHAYGDQLLAQISRRLSRRLRNCDLVARLGGDEFAIIQAECFGAAHAAEMAARVVEMCVTPIEIGTLELRVGVSVGVAVSPHHGTESAMLLRRADAAMYAAKFSGGGFRVYSPELDRLQTLGRSEADRPTDLRPAGASHAAWGDPVTAQ